MGAIDGLSDTLQGQGPGPGSNAAMTTMDGGNNGSGRGSGGDTHLLNGGSLSMSYKHPHLLSSEDREQALQSLIERACAELNADLVSVFAYNDATKHLDCTFSKDIKGFSIPITKGIVGSAFRMGHVINVTETARDTRHHPEGTYVLYSQTRDTYTNTNVRYSQTRHIHKHKHKHTFSLYFITYALVATPLHINYHKVLTINQPSPLDYFTVPSGP